MQLNGSTDRYILNEDKKTIPYRKINILSND